VPSVEAGTRFTGTAHESVRNLVPFNRCRELGPSPFDPGVGPNLLNNSITRRIRDAILGRAFIPRNLDGPDSVIIWSYDPKQIFDNGGGVLARTPR
jgi:hypothetical protein